MTTTLPTVDTDALVTATGGTGELPCPSSQTPQLPLERLAAPWLNRNLPPRLPVQPQLVPSQP